MTIHRLFAALLQTLPLLIVVASARAALTDLATAPIVTSNTVTTLPNVLFLLDDSGSMAWTHMPDDNSDSGSSSTTFNYGYYGYRSSQCNGVYYNPNISYTPPIKADGTSYANATFANALSDGFDSSSSKVNLSTGFKAETDNSGTAAYYYRYTGTQTTEAQKTYNVSTSTFVKECSSALNNSPGKDVFVKVTVGTSEQQNFANWYSYYRTRMLMMKTAAGRAFSLLDKNYRVGFMALNTDSAFLNVGAFEGTQRTNWYNKLYNSDSNGGTALRPALSDAGRYYADKLSLSGVTVNDPMQYSCQQNFTILSTDGYWNSTNTGYQVNSSSAVGNQDGPPEVRPYLDGTNTSNTLADIAEYYYKTDLRNSSLGNCTGALGGSTDVCSNNVPMTGMDTASWQHMTTFTLGLGARGKMVYSPSYLSDTSGDYVSVKNGATANPPSVCSWQNKSTTCNWPIPGLTNSVGKLENIDDLWHAAVNGRGSYFSATDPASLATGLSNALAGVKARLGSSAAAAASNPTVTSGDNYVFTSTFTTLEWFGELIRQQIDLVTGDISTTIDWSAQAKLDTNTARTIYTFDGSGANKLKPFNYDNLNATEKAYYSQGAIASLSQFCTTGTTCLSSTAQADAAGAKLVAYLRGERTNEGPEADATKYYRQRTYLLGDIVNSEAVYVKGALNKYADIGYAAFVTSVATRQAMVYVGANDGMLHAFNADTGAELWAYIPSTVLPVLYKLADKNYASQHIYFVDGSPVRGDVYFGGSWHTILVGGLNYGGRSYYALDVTDPSNPKALWEFTNTSSGGTNLGYTFGNPVITKLKNGTWVVLVASGYNNVSPGDGIGHLYVLNAETGAVISDIETGVGSTSSPSGLARINAWVDNSMADNTASRIYGGDLMGNLWRFDINGDLGASGYDAQLLATLKDASGHVQPITDKPELGEISTYAVVYVGTGRFLGVSDLADTSQQSFYAVKDSLPTNSTPSIALYTNPRLTEDHFVKQDLTITTCPANTLSSICGTGQIVRTSTNHAVNFATDNGWYIDLPDSGERVNADSVLVFGTLVFATNTPDTSACMAGGHSMIYFLNYRTGGRVSTSTTAVVGASLGNAFATRPSVVQLPNNTVKALTRLSDGTTKVTNIPIGNPGAETRRVSWRELVTE
jgi:type IV pilus assembly protein PilY1